MWCCGFVCLFVVVVSVCVRCLFLFGVCVCVCVCVCVSNIKYSPTHPNSVKALHTDTVNCTAESVSEPVN